MNVQTSVGVEIPTSSEEDWVVAKVSRRLVWFLVLLFVCLYLDRINISSAALSMSGDPSLTATTFGLASSISYVAYIVAEIPSNLMMPRFGARIWIPRIMITWGIASTATIFATGPYGLYALRALMAFARSSRNSRGGHRGSSQWRLSLDGSGKGIVRKLVTRGALYRAHLAKVLLQRAIKAITPPQQEELPMQMQGERKITATREKVWAALNEPTVLKASIPGCEALDGTVSEGMTATAAFKVGPISARFSGKVIFSEVDPPNGYVMAGEGAGGIAGFAKGGARVSLEDVENGTLLRYNR